jgi:drug/metabolite transporter (DMT)-like permease
MKALGRWRLSGPGAGIGLAFATAVISGISIWVNASVVRQVPDAAVYTTAKNLVAAIVLVAALVACGGVGRVRRLDRESVAGLGLVAVIGGSVPFVLFFSGLAIASAPSAAFIHKTLFVWVALLAVPLLGERLGWLQLGALGVLLGGQVLVAPPGGVRWGAGETMIAAATLLWSAEVVVARRLLSRGRASIDPDVLGTARMGLGVVVLLGYLGASGRLPALLALGPSQWALIVVTGVLLAGYVATWFAALRLAPASVVTSVLVGGAVVTATLTAAQNGSAPAPAAVAGNVLILLGVAAVAALALGRRALAGAQAVDARLEP